MRILQRHKERVILSVSFQALKENKQKKPADFYLWLIGWWSTSASSWPRRRMCWTDMVSKVILWRLLPMLPLLLRGSVWTRVPPSIGLRAWVERLASRVWGVWRQCMSTFTVVRVWPRRISRTLKAQAKPLCCTYLFVFSVTLKYPLLKSTDITKDKSFL